MGTFKLLARSWILLTLLVLVNLTTGADVPYDHLQEAVNGTTINSTCDASKHLACLRGRCECKDLVHQIWASREFKVKAKITNIQSCYSRVGGDCVIDPKIITMVDGETIVLSENSNVTYLKPLDYSVYPYCVENAECKSKGKFPFVNIGECVCASGYAKTSIDTCKSETEHCLATSLSLSVVLGGLATRLIIMLCILVTKSLF